MSQYFKLVFNFVAFILLNHFVCVSFCDKQSYQVLFFNDSVLEITENFDSNSSINNQNHISASNTSILNNNKLKSDIYRSSCYSDGECDDNQICCPYNSVYSACIFSKENPCRKYIHQKCNTTQDCEKRFSFECHYVKDSRLDNKVCRCNDESAFDSSTKQCEKRIKNDTGSAMQIYKITMIFASCCLALILIIFLVCILRKSYCAPRRQVIPLDNTTIPDIFTLFPHVGNYDGGPLADGTLPPFEKPPTYDETLTLIRNEIGIPPPAYRSGNSSNQSTPSMSSRVLITNPTLFTVSDESNSGTNFGTNSSSDESLAGPSGNRSSRQGIDNPAFC